METPELKTFFRALTTSLYSILLGLAGLPIVLSNVPKISSLYDQIYVLLIAIALVSFIIAAVSFGFEYWELALGALGTAFLLNGAGKILLALAYTSDTLNLVLNVTGASLEVLIGLILILTSAKFESIELVKVGLVTSILAVVLILLEPVKTYMAGETNIITILTTILIRPSNNIVMLGSGGIFFVFLAIALFGGFLLSYLRGDVRATRGGRIFFVIAGISLTFGVAFVSLYYGVKSFMTLYSFLAYNVTPEEYFGLTTLTIPLLVVSYILSSLIYIALEGTLYEIKEAVKKPPKPKPEKKEEVPEEKVVEEEEKISLEELTPPSPKEEVGLEEFPELPEIEEFEI